MARALWATAGLDLAFADWRQAHQDGYRYCGIVEEGAIVAIAAAWRYSEEAWDAASVRTVEGHRRQGFGKAVVSFVAEHILSSGHLATCTTRPDNVAMIKTAESVGFKRC